MFGIVTLPLPELGALAWTLLVLAAASSGLSKTALPGLGTFSVAIFAAVLPAKASTGTLLLLLIIGDIFALLTYRRHANWPTLVRLIPAVAAGLVLGALFLAFADDTGVRRVIGLVLLTVIVFTLWRRRATAASAAREVPRIARFGYGTLGGFTTMVANAGGPVMSMYFLAARFDVKAFLGTAAWFFAVINLVKVPISIGLGLITVDTLFVVLVLAPAVVAGSLLGRWIAHRISQRVFEWVVVIGTIVGAVYLLI